jgi:hypothetical protein
METTSWVVQGCSLPSCADSKLVAVGDQFLPITGLAVTNGQVFWSIRQSYRIHTCLERLTGCADASTPFVPDAANSIVIDGQYIYWAADELKGRILRCKVGQQCTDPEVLAIDQDTTRSTSRWTNASFTGRTRRRAAPTRARIMRVER